MLYENMMKSIEIFIMFTTLDSKCDNRIDIHEFREGIESLQEFGWNPFPPKNIKIQIPKIGDTSETEQDSNPCEEDNEMDEER